MLLFFSFKGESESKFYRIYSKHHMMRFDPCLKDHYQVCSKSKSYIVTRQPSKDQAESYSFKHSSLSDGYHI